MFMRRDLIFKENLRKPSWIFMNLNSGGYWILLLLSTNISFVYKHVKTNIHVQMYKWHKCFCFFIDLTREPACIGPFSELVPRRYHRFFGTDILKSYLASNQSDADKFLKAADPADIPIITKKRSDTVYQHVMDNLTEDGQDAVKDISPWIFNTLVDWSSDFEKFVCSKPIGKNMLTFGCSIRLKIKNCLFPKSWPTRKNWSEQKKFIAFIVKNLFYFLLFAPFFWGGGQVH